MKGRGGTLRQLFWKRKKSDRYQGGAQTFGGEEELLHLKTLGWSLSDNLESGEEIMQWFSNFISGLLYTLEHC